MAPGPYLPPEMRQTLGGQVFEEMLRLVPEVRTHYARRGSGAFSLGVRNEDLAAALDVLRALPDDVGSEAVQAAIAPYAAKEPTVEDDGTAWRNRTPYEVGPDFDRRAAEATLLALRCTLPLPEEARGWGYAILPYMVPVRRQKVVQHLESLPKPVACVALGLGGSLAVGAWVVDPPREGTPGVFERSRSRTIEWLRDQYGDREARGLLLGYDEDMIMTAQEIEEWHQQYDIVGLTSVYGSDHPLVRERGVEFVVQFRRMAVSEPDQELRWE